MRNLKRIPAASTPEALFIPKSTSFNQLSFSPNAKFSIAVFEGGYINPMNCKMEI